MDNKVIDVCMNKAIHSLVSENEYLNFENRRLQDQISMLNQQLALINLQPYTFVQYQMPQQQLDLCTQLQMMQELKHKLEQYTPIQNVEPTHDILNQDGDTNQSGDYVEHDESKVCLNPPQMCEYEVVRSGDIVELERVVFDDNSNIQNGVYACTGREPEDLSVSSTKIRQTQTGRLIMEIGKIQMTKDQFDSIVVNRFTPVKNGNCQGWKEVKYDMSGSHLLEINEFVKEYDENGNPCLLPDDIDSDSYEKQLYITQSVEYPIFRHSIPKEYQNTIQIQDATSVIYWEAFDMPMASEWKEIVAKGLGGLTVGKMCIIRLLHKGSSDVGDVAYMSVYMKSNSLSKAMMADKKARQNGIEYDGTLRSNPTFAATMNAFDYAFKLNNEKPFVIIEQIMDYRSGSQKVILSKYRPRTEIAREYNIFKNEQMCIETNHDYNCFMCKRTKNGGFNITTTHF